MSELWRIITPLADVMQAPRRDSMRVSQALQGEAVERLSSKEGWAHIRLKADAYEGYVEEDFLGIVDAPNAQIWVPASHAYPRPDIKSAPVLPLYFGAQICLKRQEGDFFRTSQDHFIKAAHILAPMPEDIASFAESFLNVPYLWGGKSFAGIDCSGLVQLAFLSRKQSVARDSGPQSQSLGKILVDGQAFARNDLIFWPGHVGIFISATEIIHANAHHMKVVKEDLEMAIARIGKPSLIRRN